MESSPVSRESIEQASQRIAPLLRRTPTMTTPGSELGLEGTISFKLEYLQQSGSFKARGATNFMTANEISDAGVTAASGGNHGAAVAWAARELGHKATIFVPTISSPTKVDRLRSYGADVHQVGAVYSESLEHCEAFQSETGATAIHAYNDPVVVAGAGTTGLELDRDTTTVGPVDSVLVACGGGGLAAGIASWFDESTAIVACETETTTAFAEAKKAGHPVDVEVSGIAADALGATSIGDVPYAALQAADTQSVLVSNDAVVDAQNLLWDRFRIVVEPSAAVPVAAVISGQWQAKPGSHTAIVVCGANTTLH